MVVTATWHSCLDRCLSSEPAKTNFKFTCWVSCFHFTWEQTGWYHKSGEGSIYPIQPCGTSLGDKLTARVIIMVEIVCEMVQQRLYTVFRIMLYPHTPFAKPMCLLDTPRLCLFLGQTNSFQIPSIFFSFCAKYKPCYPLCLEHPPTCQTILFFISALISKSSSFRWV